MQREGSWKVHGRSHQIRRAVAYVHLHAEGRFMEGSWKEPPDPSSCRLCTPACRGKVHGRFMEGANRSVELSPMYTCMQREGSWKVHGRSQQVRRAVAYVHLHAEGRL